MAEVIQFHSRARLRSRDIVGRRTAAYNGPSVSIQIETAVHEGEPFLVGEWLVEPKLNRVSRGDATVQLELKAMNVLLCLVERAGDLVTKHELLDAVWQTEFVADNTLTHRIAQLRSAFGDDSKDPRYIETIHKRGYRLIADVGPVTMAAENMPVGTDLPASSEEGDNPYPGLAAFTESDADRFFGREAESAALWRKISSRRLLAVIGPSGVGKSSLLRAGVAARAPPGWRVVVFTPGENPTLSLARALAPDHAGNAAAMARLLGFTDADTALAVVSRWRGQFDGAVLIVDQFEELFTLNPPEVQSSFIELLRRLVDAVDVHVVLGMRDDFLHHCQPHQPIAPIFESLTPLGPPDAAGLRRALKEPAARRQVRFSTEVLVDRMIAEVEGERGALPLMAFAVRRLWEERDREDRRLTEEAYGRIGGVAGALAKHADATLERIGPERLPIVRELFRNLLTAEGTRAIREADDLLSVFPERQRESAEQVLRELIDARLLTGYREQDDDEHSTRSVEIVHESLLSSWPRLVRWQTQDADSARLRDELRQAARTWDQHDRARDYLWTGKAFREFSVWRENYSGGLSDLEDDFAWAMTSLATRRRRRRGAVATVGFSVLVAVLAVVGMLWRRSVHETRRAEAAKVLALGQLRLADYPTATLAHAIASLELADTAEARRLALRSLWKGPTAFVINTEQSRGIEFTPDGSWLVQTMQKHDAPQVGIVSEDGTRRDLDQIFEFQLMMAVMNPDGTALLSKPERLLGSPEHVVLWSLPEGRKLCDVQIDAPAAMHPWLIGWSRNRAVAIVWEDRAGERASVYAFNFDGTHERLGTLDFEVRPGWSRRTAIDPRTGRWIAFMRDEVVSVCEVGEHGLSRPRVLGRHEGGGHCLAVDREGRLIATSDAEGRIRIWDLRSNSPALVTHGPKGIDRIAFFGSEPRLAARTEDDDGQRIWVYAVADGDLRLLRTIAAGQAGDLGLRQVVNWDTSGQLLARDGPDQWTRVWPLAAPADAEPITLKRGEVGMAWWHSFHPTGEWLATSDLSGLMTWPLGRPFPSVIRAHQKPVWSVAFGPGGRWLVSGCVDGLVRLTPLDGEVPESGRVVGRRPSPIRSIATSPDGAQILVGEEVFGATVIPLDGEALRPLGDLVSAYGVALRQDGQLAALAGMVDGWASALQILRSDGQEEKRILHGDERAVSATPRFLNDDRIVFSRQSGLWILDPTTGDSEQLFEGQCHQFDISEDGRRLVVVDQAELGFVSESRVLVLDLDAGAMTHLASHGDEVWSIALDPTGTIVATGDRGGVLRVGPVSGAEPHLLLGHEGRIWDVEFDPLGRWIATGGQDGTVRIWPMPDLTKPPLHTLPHDELLTKLKTLTNLRLVRDEEDPTGWTLTHDPFPGWETVPTW